MTSRGPGPSYAELRAKLDMPSGQSEKIDQSRLATQQATFRKGLVIRHSNASQLLNYEHFAERAGTAIERLGRHTDQFHYRDQARRVFSLAKLALQRRHAIDSRTQGGNDHQRIHSLDQAQRQARAQEAAKGGRVLSADERASLPAAEANAVRDREANSKGRIFGAQRDHGPKPGAKQNTRGGGGRSR